ncbi:hypothetical protein [Tsukamurella sp. 1534]|uniref:hypothetical protein n=1 Tax=Tsukamurella sp. 1534 TaxID=1151061 RepID=UPI0002FA41D4|nr:hypothetical protein [Tsukamurella sp. 1534]
MLIPVPIVRRIEHDGTPPPPPEIQQVRAVVASILGSLRGSEHLPDSGLNWAAAYVTRDRTHQVVVTTTDAGWLPPGVLVPRGARVLWNVPTAVPWSAVDDPVRQLVEFAATEGLTISALATTHRSRAHYSPAAPGRLVGVDRPGPVLDGGAGRFELVSSPTRVAQIRAMTPEQADRQTRALLRDLERLTVEPAHAIGLEEARAEARRFLGSGREVPTAVLAQLHRDEEALDDALALGRIDPRVPSPGAPPPSGRELRDRLLERAVLAATIAGAYHDVESAVYAWTFARHLARA